MHIVCLQVITRKIALDRQKVHLETPEELSHQQDFLDILLSGISHIRSCMTSSSCQEALGTSCQVLRWGYANEDSSNNTFSEVWWWLKPFNQWRTGRGQCVCIWRYGFCQKDTTSIAATNLQISLSLQINQNVHPTPQSSKTDYLFQKFKKLNDIYIVISYYQGMTLLEPLYPGPCTFLVRTGSTLTSAIRRWVPGPNLGFNTPRHSGLFMFSEGKR